MSVTNTLATVFTLLLFVFFVVSLYEQANGELFQQYKGIIFTGSMFVVLAILGLPYMQYDVAHKPPSFAFISTAIGILAILCVILMFILDIPFDTFVAYISTFVILLTIWGRATSGGTSDTFPAFAKELLLFVLAGSVLFGTSALASMAMQRNMIPVELLRTVLVYYIQLVPVALGSMLVYALYKAVNGLIEYRTQKRSCTKTASNIPAFEGFQTSNDKDTVSTLPKELEVAIHRAEETINSLVEQTDDTCAIIKEVEQGYVGAKSGVIDEAEYKLPEDEQLRRRQSRQDRAMKAFATNRRIYAATRNVTPLECFQNPNSIDEEVTEYEITLRELCTQLHSLLENVETLAQIKKVQQMHSDLDFSDRQLNKAEAETFQNPPSVTPTNPTQIYSTLRSAELETAARNLLQKEGTLYASVVSLQKKITNVRGRLGKAYQKMNMVETGDYSVPSS